MNGEAKQPGPEAEEVGERKPYEPPAIVWEEELKAIAADSCATVDIFACDPRPSQ